MFLFDEDIVWQLLYIWLTFWSYLWPTLNLNYLWFWWHFDLNNLWPKLDLSWPTFDLNYLWPSVDLSNLWLTFDLNYLWLTVYLDYVWPTFDLNQYVPRDSTVMQVFEMPVPHIMIYLCLVTWPSLFDNVTLTFFS